MVGVTGQKFHNYLLRDRSDYLKWTCIRYSLQKSANSANFTLTILLLHYIPEENTVIFKQVQSKS